jgi:hypothetical protein
LWHLTMREGVLLEVDSEEEDEEVEKGHHRI